MAEQALKGNNSLLGQMFMEAPLSCGRMGRHFLVLPRHKESRLRASQPGYGARVREAVYAVG